jgi:hypothetical protein
MFSGEEQYSRPVNSPSSPRSLPLPVVIQLFLIIQPRVVVPGLKSPLNKMRSILFVRGFLPVFTFYTPLGIKISPGKILREIVRQKLGGVTGVEPPEWG